MSPRAWPVFCYASLAICAMKHSTRRHVAQITSDGGTLFQGGISFHIMQSCVFY